MSVATVAAVVGVAPSTLRTWARRYGLEPSGHRSGLHRRYTAADLHRLQLMRALTQAGLTSREAAARAREASPEQLSLATGTRRLGEQLAIMGGDGSSTADGPIAQRWDRSLLDALDQPIRTLLITAGRGDARGATELLRHAIRELGAARTFDERVLAARSTVWMLPPPAQDRALAVIAAACVSAVGEVTVRRTPRNVVPVVVGALPGAQDEAALVLATAAVAERSMASSRVDLGRQAGDVRPRIAALGPGVAMVYVADGSFDGDLVTQLRATVPTRVVVWGQGWVNWPGQDAPLSEVVRAVETAAVASS